MVKKHYSDYRKKRGLTRSAALLIAVVSLVAVVVGGTAAYLSTKTDTKVNTFTKGVVSCAIDETFQNGVKKDVKVRNTGNTSAYIRAMIVVSWKNARGEVYGGASPKADTDYTMSLNTNDWVKNGGYWYYKKPVAKEASTTNLINTCTESTANVPQGYGLAVDIIADAVQSGPNNTPASEAWGFVPSGS